MKDMNENGIGIRIQGKMVSFENLEQYFENNFLIQCWCSEDLKFSLCTKTSLQNFQIVLEHPSISALYNSLKRANPDEYYSNIRKWTENKSNQCNICRKYGNKPRRLQVIIVTNDLKFNQIIAIDTMFTFGKPIIHIVEKATNFLASKFMEK